MRQIKNMTKNKNILIGITGSIAAYKTCEIIRLFKKSGYDVKTVVTEAALQFIGKKTLETLTNNPVYFDMFQDRMETEHISLADWVNAFVIAPISANSISKIANGIADNLLTSIACAYLGKNKPLYIAPAMNEGMWSNIFVQENIMRLKDAGVKIINPVEGELACGYVGIGKMETPENIFAAVNSDVRPKNNKKVLITSGGTREYIDPVRFITNASSGKMGKALADCAYKMGYDVVFVTTNNIQAPYKTILAESADEMMAVVEQEFQDSDYLIMAAAVSDFKVENYKSSKIRKSEIKNGSYNIELNQNIDILKCIARTKSDSQKVIGFSLATENVIEIGIEKLEDKNCDYIIANEAQTSLNSEDTEVWVIDKDKNITPLEKAPKEIIAQEILEIVL